MRLVEVGEDRRLAVVERPLDAPGTGQVVVDVAFCGICGSDLHFRDVPQLFPAGTVPGHEISGRISELGADVSRWAVGDRVAVLPFAQCGSCDACLAGNEQVCPSAVPNGVGLGTGRPGAYAERLVVDERMLFALPDQVSDRAGTLVEPLAVAVRAVDVAELPAAEPVAVLGAGPVGLLTALVLRARGYSRATIVSRNPVRAEKAIRLGLQVASLGGIEEDAAGVGGFACVVECAGTPNAARLAVDLLRPLGSVILVGMSMEPLDLAAPPLIINEVTIRGVLTYTRSQFAEAIDLLATGEVPGDDLITGTAPLEEAEEMFQTLTSPGNPHLKVVLQP
ncbi:MAG TPA: alcohol dehydrogenase catalytic domain-containing protein [Solirubrobacteraceae bacterium]|nr:alcohol dehydrogenase catalytic domain-containing protein [Solirubrobacteraceae bacterium]